ncbi:MAG: outer membrane lipoprotein carrier protein LolA [Deltaproteobacteria bacterium]|nr:outer membrane lipoprotein carrier protein LolA [Deltaproteobacteria bacterium]
MRRMWIWSLVLGSLLAGPVLAGGQSAAEVVDGMQKLYESTRDFKAAFQQEYTSAALGRKKVSRGYVYVKKPGMMRWDYVEPGPKHFVSDGKALYVFDPELEQVMVDRAFTGSQLSTAVTFLWGRGKLRDEFLVKFGEREGLGGDGFHVLELVPKKRARFKKLWFVVEKDSFRVTETIVQDPGDNFNHIRFSKMATNVGLKDEAFHFAIPEGMEVIEAPKQQP